MKKLLLLATLIALTGCQTVTNTDGSTTKTVDPIVLEGIAQNATAVGTIIWLESHPQDRQAFAIARTAVKALLASGNGSPADLQAALSTLPIKQLQGQKGAVIVASAVTLIDIAGRQLVSQDKQHVWSNYVQPIAQGIADGLDQALAQ